jgi:hypothetical protein
MRRVQVLTRQEGGPDFAVGRDHGVLDLPHPDAEARARFSRPGRFPVDALWWTDDGVAGAPSGTLFDLELSVTPHVGWDASTGRGDTADTSGTDTAGVVKQVSFLHASEGTSLEEFRAHYRAHVDLARTHMPALWQYRQNDVVEVRGAQRGAAAGIVAISELWFRSVDDFLHHYFASAEAQADFQAHEGFLDLPKAFSFVCSSHRLRDARA